ncbi:MAG: PAS domain S-box protein [Elusimicrobia bacterium]|nr:PAS domain S-box protein [Elusimicrobiota bacterium]
MIIRKELENKFTKTDESIKQIAELINMWIWETDVNGLYVYSSPAVERIFGFKPEEIVGKKYFYDFFVADRKKELKEYLFKIYNNRESYIDFVNYNLSKNGNIIVLKTAGMPVLDEKGALLGYHGVSIDITKPKQAEERLIELNECFLGFSSNPLDNINRLISYVGKLFNADCALYNRLDKGVLRSLGQWHTPPDFNPVDKPDGHICYDVIKNVANDVFVIRNLPETHYAKTDPNVIRYKLQTYIGIAVKFNKKSVGSLCIVCQRDVIPTENEKKLLEIVALAIGIEESRRYVEVSLLESEQKFRTIAEYSPNMIFINKQGKVVYANKRCEEIIGYKKDELTSPDFDFLTLIAPESKEFVMKSYNNHLNGKEVGTYEYQIFTKKGKIIPVIIATKIIKYEEGNAVLGIITDITERKKIEQILKNDKEKIEYIANKRVGELVKIKKKLTEVKRLSDIGTLAATVAHELRNPLGVIRLAIYNMSKKNTNKSLESHIVNVEKKLMESEQIINNLLNYSKLKIPNYGKVRIYDILKESISFTKKIFCKQNVTVVEKFKSLKLKYIDADSYQISEILNNILSNAYQSVVDKKGKIEVAARLVKKEFIVLTISDNGVGIDEKDIEKVFDPFFTKKPKGTGLGLTICNELVNLHNGEIKIQSTKGKGTVLTLKIPVKKKN